MCGIFAAFANSKHYYEKYEQIAKDLYSRGPDAEGHLNKENIHLIHRRLSIQDLSEAGNQPLKSPCEKYAIIFNGEIYNFKELKEELEKKGYQFKTNTDTEVLLHLYISEKENMLYKLRGMFAFIIVNFEENTAFAARDPYGIKPLYYAETNEGIYLCSQVKPLVNSNLVDSSPSYEGQAGFWLLGSVPEPYTWYKSIKAIPSGNFIKFKNNKISSVNRWHSIGESYLNSDNKENLITNEKEIEKKIIKAIRESISYHLVSDTPIGILLSGGIDSCAIAGTVSDLTKEEIKGFTISFSDYKKTEYDESNRAIIAANKYNLKHINTEVSKKDFLEDLPFILSAMDQPSIDGFNTWYAAKSVAKSGIKVALSGIGGDEIFFGYDFYKKYPFLMKLKRKLSNWDKKSNLINLLLFFQFKRTKNPKWLSLSESLKTTKFSWFHKRSSKTFEDLFKLLPRDELKNFLCVDFFFSIVEESTGKLSSDPKIALAQLDATLYLKNQLLKDSDWASMHHSVELRTPLVDSFLLNNISPFFPYISKNKHKALLINSPNCPLPSEVGNAKKTGFSFPINKWIGKENQTLSVLSQSIFKK